LRPLCVRSTLVLRCALRSLCVCFAFALRLLSVLCVCSAFALRPLCVRSAFALLSVRSLCIVFTFALRSLFVGTAVVSDFSLHVLRIIFTSI
jgi:hypothetical protein